MSRDASLPPRTVDESLAEARAALHFVSGSAGQALYVEAAQSGVAEAGAPT